MSRNILLIFLLFLSLSNALGQRKFIRGKVQDATNGESLIGVGIRIYETGQGTTTDTAGRFNISLRKGTYTLIFTYSGFFRKDVRVDVKDDDQFFTVKMDERSESLEEVQVSGASAQQNVNRLETGVSKLNIKTIKKMPTLLGEADIVKSLLMLPGVTTVGEGATGFNVRGGSVDQNLILMDEAPIFNSSHLMGLFSVFNPDAVRGLTFYRGGVPAQYGGRTSSVLNIDLKDANAQKTNISGGIGLVSSRLMLEVPLIKDKLSVFSAYRVSYADYLFKLVKNKSVQDTRAGFSDLTSKVDFKPSSKDKVWITHFFSKDRFKLSGDSLANLEVNATSTAFDWRSNNLSAGWSHSFKKITPKLVYARSNYSANIANPDTALAFNLKSGVLYESIKLNMNYPLGKKNSLDFGLQGINYSVDPGSLIPASNVSNINAILIQKEKGTEAAAFISDEISLNKALSLMIGTRYSWFGNKGPFTRFVYDPKQPKSELSIVDSIVVGSGYQTNYQGFEPRMSLKLSFSERSSFKASYNRMRQYLQLVSNTTAALPTDRWKIADSFIRPQIADQYAVGFFQNTKNAKIETSVEVFYKDMTDIVDYRDGFRPLLNKHVESGLLQGIGRAYGAELYAKKNLGQLNGWLSYTYSITEFKVKGNFAEETINGGNWYFPNYQKPHVVNAVINWQINKKSSFSSNITYSTGRPITYPQDKYYLNGVYIPNYVYRNDSKIPDYFRTDLAYTLDINRNDRFYSSLAFSVYNLTNRRNAYSIFFKTKSRYSNYYNKVDIYKLSILGSALPSITYNFRF